MADDVTGRTAELLDDQEWVSRESEVRDEVMEVRAINRDGGIRGRITDIRVSDAFAPYMYTRFSCEQKDGTYPPTHGSSSPSRDEIHNSVDSQVSGGGFRNRTYAIVYDPEVATVVELENGDTVNFKSTRGFRTWSPESSVPMAVYEAMGYDFERVVEEQPRILYEPSSDTGGDFAVETAKRGEVTTHKRAHEGCIEERERRGTTFVYETASSTLFARWLDYLRDAASNKTDWVQTQVVEPFGDENTFSLVVQTPTGKTAFQIQRSKDEDSLFWKVVEELGGGDPSQVGGERVWIRPRIKSMFDDNTVAGFRNNSSYVLTDDVEREWELAIENPNIARDRVKRTIVGRVKDAVF